VVVFAERVRIALADGAAELSFQAQADIFFVKRTSGSR
jgi:hypothetical protein